MNSGSDGRRDDLTPVIVHTDLSVRGGGLARAVPERASLYARHFKRVVILTTGFTPELDAILTELRERGSLDERVIVRNFFQHSSWIAGLGVPPAAALAKQGPDVVSVAQQLPGRSAFRVADRHADQKHPYGYRYYDTEGTLVLTSTSANATKRHELTAVAPGWRARPGAWGSIVARWVDEEIASLPRPVLFSLQRGLIDPVLVATTKASRKVVSLHNCHYEDPDDNTSGIRRTFRTAFSPGAVDEIVCLTEQQRHELEVDVPHAVLRTISYPGRVPREEPVAKDMSLVVMVAQLQERKRVDHAICAFGLVVARVPGARLDVYGAGPETRALQRLITELGLQGSVTLKGYSHQVGVEQARAACTLLTSTFEGFARVISESMCRGTPVVAYDIRYGPRDLIRDGTDGVLVPTQTPEALAEAIVELLNDPGRASRMGLEAKQTLDRFPVADFERSWLEVLSPQPGAATKRVTSAVRTSRPHRAARRLRALVRG